ncbi:hypothetical protein MUK42_03008 [Musa troglodytarum]|uniref:Uncharacterized protein n=1 Tax=Musa troglodytarum TaxID=320322 RepID=A0A9E7K2W9_9LILI|nr:hypothetical protein MUK42_03008 [Musa troglodytarum]
MNFAMQPNMLDRTIIDQECRSQASIFCAVLQSSVDLLIVLNEENLSISTHNNTHTECTGAFLECLCACQNSSGAMHPKQTMDSVQFED